MDWLLVAALGVLVFTVGIRVGRAFALAGQTIDRDLDEAALAAEADRTEHL